MDREVIIFYGEKYETFVNIMTKIEELMLNIMFRLF